MTEAVGSAVPPTGPPREARPPLPLSATAIPVLGLVGEVVLMADDGVRAAGAGTTFSMVLTAAVVAWVSYGVLTGRTVRRVLALVLLGLAAFVDLLDLVLAAFAGAGAGAGSGVDGWDVLYVITSIAMFAALVALVSSSYDAWQRRHHDASGSGVARVVVLAALVGLLGPLSSPGPESGRGFHVQLNLGQEPLSDSDSTPNFL